jgi:hypothetical protein
LLKEALPTLSRLGFLWDSTVGLVQFRAAEAATRTAGVAPVSLPVQHLEDFKDAFARAASERVDAVVLLSSPLIFGQRSQIADLALRARLPTISLFTLYPRTGGLMAYGPNFPDMWERAATYIDRLLKGAKTGELPIQRPSKFELVINLKTAKEPTTDRHRAKQRIDRGAGVVLPRADSQRQPVTIHQQMALRRRNINSALLELLAIPGERRWQRSISGEDGIEIRSEAIRQMNDDHDRCRQVAWNSRQT